MPSNASNSKGLSSGLAVPAQEEWKNLGVPLRLSMHQDVHAIAQRMGLKGAQWARLVIADAVARAKAA